MISFGFWILWISILKILLALTLQLQRPKRYIFDIQSYLADCENCWYFFSEIYVSLSNCDMAFYIYKDIWKELKTIIIVAVSINVITNDNFIIISILYIIAELIELHELTLIASFLFFFDCKSSYRRTK